MPENSPRMVGEKGQNLGYTHCKLGYGHCKLGTSHGKRGYGHCNEKQPPVR